MGLSTRQIVGAFAAALAGGLAGMFLFLILGLIVSEYVVVVLALAEAALLASLGGVWAANSLSSGGIRTRLLPVVGATETVAAIMAVVVLAVEALRSALLGPVLYVGIVCALVLALAATLAIGYFRTPDKGGNDAAFTGWLILAGILLVPAVFLVAWLVGLTGA